MIKKIVLVITVSLLGLTVSGCANDGKLSTVTSASNKKSTGRVDKKSYSYTVRGKQYHVNSSVKKYSKVGIASWYGADFHGGKTANGERYNQYALTAAHKTLPLGSIVRVENLSNGKKVTVRINDRGPFIAGRIIDLSKAAAKKIDMHDDGITKVRVTLIKVASNGTSAQAASSDNKILADDDTNASQYTQ